jgi:membrane-associated phospholipid phosphatase
MWQKRIVDMTLAGTRGRVAAGRRRLRSPRAVLANMSTAGRVFALLLVLYVAFTAVIVLKTPVLDADQVIFDLRLKRNNPELYPWLHTYVMLGQRGPATLAALPWFIWIACRRRTLHPLVMLAVALVVLNLSVGIVKIATGRLGPRGGHPVDAMWAGGNIYPSGHVSNAVVLYGLIAMLVAARYRRAAVLTGVFITVTVGISTLFINTHWATDIVGGILAGGLVLCSLHWVVPPTERWIERVRSRWRGRRGGRDLAFPEAGTHVVLLPEDDEQRDRVLA